MHSQEQGPGITFYHVPRRETSSWLYYEKDLLHTRRSYTKAHFWTFLALYSWVKFMMSSLPKSLHVFYFCYNLWGFAFPVGVLYKNIAERRVKKLELNLIFKNTMVSLKYIVSFFLTEICWISIQPLNRWSAILYNLWSLLFLLPSLFGFQTFLTKRYIYSLETQGAVDF